MGLTVTISREMGCGGEAIAKAVAQELGLRLVGSELIHQAIEAGIPADIAVESLVEEEKPGFVQKALEFLRAQPGPSESVSLVGSEPIDAYITTRLVETDEMYYHSILESIVFDLAERENILLLGRAGQMMLRGKPNTFHVRLWAPLEKRIAAVTRRLNIDEKEARKRIDETDEARAAFLRRHYHVDISDCHLYDLALNTAAFAPDQTVRLIVDAVRASQNELLRA